MDIFDPNSPLMALASIVGIGYSVYTLYDNIKKWRKGKESRSYLIVISIFALILLMGLGTYFYFYVNGFYR